MKIIEKNITRILPTYSLRGHNAGVYSVKLFADDKYLISGDWGGQIKIWELGEKSGKCLLTFKPHDHLVSDIALFDNEQKVITSSFDNTLNVLNLRTYENLFILKGHKTQINSVSVSSDGKHAVSGSWDGEIKFWNLENGKCTKVLKDTQTRFIYKVAFFSNDEKIIYSSFSNMINIYDLKTGEFSRFGDNEDPIKVISFFSDGRRIMTGSRFGKLGIWDIESGECLVKINGTFNESPVHSLSIFHNNRMAISTSTNALKIWNLEEKIEHFSTLGLHDNIVEGLCLSKDGKQVISASRDETLKVWDLGEVFAKL